jgi:hypothetical protein
VDEPAPKPAAHPEKPKEVEKIPSEKQKRSFLNRVFSAMGLNFD